MDAKWEEIDIAHPFSNLLEMPSGPEATSDLKDLITLKTSSPVHSKEDRQGVSPISAGCAGTEVDLVKFLTKLSLSKSAWATGVVAAEEPFVMVDGTRL